MTSVCQETSGGGPRDSTPRVLRRREHPALFRWPPQASAPAGGPSWGPGAPRSEARSRTAPFAHPHGVRLPPTAPATPAPEQHDPSRPSLSPGSVRLQEAEAASRRTPPSSHAALRLRILPAAPTPGGRGARRRHSPEAQSAPRRSAQVGSHPPAGPDWSLRARLPRTGVSFSETPASRRTCAGHAPGPERSAPPRGSETWSPGPARRPRCARRGETVL